MSYAGGTVWLEKKQTCGFVGVPEAVWNLHIGGYGSRERWLKDRKGRTLSKDEDRLAQGDDDLLIVGDVA